MWTLPGMDREKARSKLETLYGKYCQEAYRQAFAVLKDERDAEDAVQETFFRIWKHLDKLKDEDSNSAKWYVVCVARNVAIDLYRKKKSRWQKEEPLEEAFSHVNAEQPLDGDAGVLERIAAFPDRERDALTLRYVYGFRNGEIAKLLGISPEAAKKALMRAKNRLEKVCREEGLTND